MIVLLSLSSYFFSSAHIKYQKGSLTMKTIVRCLVIALAVTGAIATTCAKAAPAKATVTISKTSAMPQPTCDPNDPGDCGLSGD